MLLVMHAFASAHDICMLNRVACGVGLVHAHQVSDISVDSMWLSCIGMGENTCFAAALLYLAKMGCGLSSSNCSANVHCHCRWMRLLNTAWSRTGRIHKHASFACSLSSDSKPRRVLSLQVNKPPDHNYVKAWDASFAAAR